MKKFLFSIALVAALATACQKNNHDEDRPDEPVGKQKVSLGTKMTPQTKSSINNMTEWSAAGKGIYVMSINDSTSVTTERIFIDNAKATIATTPTDSTGTITFEKTYYYGVSEHDIYSFYAYYLGYDLAAGDPKAQYWGKDSIFIPSVKIKGNNDIMTAITDKYADAQVSPTEMVSPKIVYSGRSARLGVVPNLRFSHSLSKFVFWVQIGDTATVTNKMYLDSITMDSPTTGKLVLLGKQPGFIPTSVKSNIKLEMDGSVELSKTSKRISESLMLASAGKGNYTLALHYHEIVDDTTLNRTLSTTIKPSDVVVSTETGEKAEKFESGKAYKVEVKVYPAKAVVAKVQLKPWDEAGTITVDPESGEGKIDGPVVTAMMGGNTFHLQLVKDKAVAVGDPVVDVKTEAAPADGVYVLTPAVTIKGATITKLTIAAGSITKIE